MTVERGAGDAYAAAGVDINAQDRALAEVKKLARATFTPGVLSEIGSFGGLFKPPLAGMEEPILVASADGVGTKLMVARMLGNYSSVGRDLVNHCVNDILVQGATPLFFLDYVGAGELEPAAMIDLVRGVADGCRDNGCALLGGETAEMPGFYRPGDYELVGFIVGLVDRRHVLDGTKVRAGDRLIGLPSAGLHTNGYSLARRVLFERLGLSVGDPVPHRPDAPEREDWAETVGAELLKPHLSYLRAVRPLLGLPELHAMAHITGGGLTDNLPRALPAGFQAVLRRDAWRVPPLFRLLQEEGNVPAEEMFRIFNMGIGLVLLVDAAGADGVLAGLRERGQPGFELGEVRSGERCVVYEPGFAGGQA